MATIPFLTGVRVSPYKIGTGLTTEATTTIVTTTTSAPTTTFAWETTTSSPITSTFGQNTTAFVEPATESSVEMVTESASQELNEQFSQIMDRQVKQQAMGMAGQDQDSTITDVVVWLAAAFMCLYFINKAVNEIYFLAASYIEYSTRHPRDYNGWRRRFWILTEMILRTVWIPLWFTHERIWYRVIEDNLDQEYQIWRRRNMMQLGNPVSMIRRRDDRNDDRDDDNEGRRNGGNAAAPIPIGMEVNNNDNGQNNGNNNGGNVRHNHNGGDAALQRAASFRAEVHQPVRRQEPNGGQRLNNNNVSYGCGFTIYHDEREGPILPARDLNLVSPPRIPRLVILSKNRGRTF